MRRRQRNLITICTVYFFEDATALLKLDIKSLFYQKNKDFSFGDVYFNSGWQGPTLKKRHKDATSFD